MKIENQYLLPESMVDQMLNKESFRTSSPSEGLPMLSNTCVRAYSSTQNGFSRQLSVSLKLEHIQ